MKDQVESRSALMKEELNRLQQLEHPHICRVLDLCEDKDNYYIASELVEHGNLYELMTDKDQTLKESDVANIIY